jgi:hypothetical protein
MTTTMPNKNERLEAKAQEVYSKSFAELAPEERIRVGGMVGGQLKGGEMAYPEAAPPPPEVKFGEKNT